MNEAVIGIGTTIIGVVGTLSAIWLKHYLDRRKHRHDCIIDKTVKDDCELIGRLDDLKNEIEADRISIFSFHNGGEYYSGKSMQKLSCSYETVQPGVARTQLDLQNIPVSACLGTLTHLMENKEFHCYDIEANYPESACKYQLINTGVKSTYQYAIFDLNKKAIGILRADFVLDKEHIDDKAHESLKYTAIKLAGYLLK